MIIVFSSYTSILLIIYISCAQILLAQCAGTVKKTSMELGGNAPLIVFDSGDLNLAAEGVIASRFRCTGQVGKTIVYIRLFLINDKCSDTMLKKYLFLCVYIIISHKMNTDYLCL